MRLQPASHCDPMVAAKVACSYETQPAGALLVGGDAAHTSALPRYRLTY